MARVKVPSIIDSNFGLDESENLADFLASVPDGSLIEWPDGGDYRADAGLLIQDRHGLIFWGKGGGSTIRPGTNGDEQPNPKNRRTLHFVGGSDHCIYNMTIRGANPQGGTSDNAYVQARESQHGVEIRGTQRMKMDLLRVYDTYGDYVYIGPRTVTFDLPTDIRCRRFDFQRNGRQGISVTGGQRIRFEYGYMGENRRAALDIEPNDPVLIEDVTLSEVLVGPTRLNFFSCIGDLQAEIRNVTFEFMITFGSSGPDFAETTFNSNIGTTQVGVGKRSGFRYAWSLSGNARGANTQGVIVAYRIEDLTVIGVRQPMEADRNMRMVRIGLCDGVRVMDGIFPRAVGAIRLDGVGGNNDYCSTRCQIGLPLENEQPLVTCP